MNFHFPLTFLCCLLTLFGGLVSAQEVEVPKALAAPVEGEEAVPEAAAAPEAGAMPELEVPEEDKLDLLSADAWPGFVEQLGSGAKLHLGEEGFAQIEIVDEETNARAALTVTDLLGAEDKVESFEESRIKVGKFPAATASNLGNETEVLAGGRFQINLRADSTKFDEAMRISWLEKHRSALNGLNPNGFSFSLSKWLVPVVLGVAALFLLGILWVSRGSSERVRKPAAAAGGRRRD